MKRLTPLYLELHVSLGMDSKKNLIKLCKNSIIDLARNSSSEQISISLMENTRNKTVISRRLLNDLYQTISHTALILLSRRIVACSKLINDSRTCRIISLFIDIKMVKFCNLSHLKMFTRYV